MSNDIVKHQNQSLIPDAKNMRLLAEDFQKSEMFPNVKSLAGFVTIIEYGRELGIPPVAALQTMAIISGKITIESKAMLALFLKGGGLSRLSKRIRQALLLSLRKRRES